MIDFKSLLRLEILEPQVTMQEYAAAMMKAIKDPRLPERKPHGDPQNLERANMLLRLVVENLEEIVSSKS